MPTPQLTIYDFDQVTVALGAILFDGFQDGEGVSIEQEDSFTDKNGIDGKTVRSKTYNYTATVMINLMQTSACNDLLSALLNVDQAAPKGAGIVPLYIRDRNGRALYTAAQAWIAGPPQVTYDGEATVRSWKIRCSRLVRIDGGN